MASEEDCLGCRLASAGGLFIACVYIYRQALNKTPFNRYGMLSISTGMSLKYYHKQCFKKSV